MASEVPSDKTLSMRVNFTIGMSQICIENIYFTSQACSRYNFIPLSLYKTTQTDILKTAVNQNAQWAKYHSMIRS